MAEKLSVYLDDNVMFKLHDLHKLVSANVPGGVSVSKAIAYAVITCWNLEFVEKLSNFTAEEMAVVAKYAPQPLEGGNGGQQE